MPQREFNFWVYILANRSRTLYVGMTNNLFRRTLQHREAASSFTSRYKIHRLVYFEHFRYANNAIQREKELKRCSRMQKIALIETSNPTWDDVCVELAAGTNYPLDDSLAQLP